MKKVLNLGKNTDNFLAQIAAASLKACSHMSTHAYTHTHSHTYQQTHKNLLQKNVLLFLLGSVCCFFRSNGWRRFVQKPEKGSAGAVGAAGLHTKACKRLNCGAQGCSAGGFPGHKACKRLPLRMVEGARVGR